MQELSFYKYQATGNDFVMVDQRQQEFELTTEQVAFLCDRRFGIGADGLILLRNDNQSDFRMVYYNSDGNESTMCGNGGRALVAFARDLEVIADKTEFVAIDGMHDAQIEGKIVSLHMVDVSEIENHPNHYFLNTGSPHHVEEREDTDQIDIQKEGAEIRYGAPYFKEGTNVNFVEKLEEAVYKARTYERGVEGETYSCGTGVTAVALAMHHKGDLKQNSTKIVTKGGELSIAFEACETGYKNIYLTGPAQFVFKGTINF